MVPIESNLQFSLKSLVNAEVRYAVSSKKWALYTIFRVFTHYEQCSCHVNYSNCLLFRCHIDTSVIMLIATSFKREIDNCYLSTLK